MLLNPFRVQWRNSFYCQGLRCIPRQQKQNRQSPHKQRPVYRSCFRPSTATILHAALASLTACRPLRNDAFGTSRLKPGAIAQCSGKSDTPGMDRDEIIELLQCFRIFAKTRVDPGSEQGGFNKTRILPKGFVTILNSEIVFALPCKNLRADVQRRPKVGSV